MTCFTKERCMLNRDEPKGSLLSTSCSGRLCWVSMTTLSRAVPVAAGRVKPGGALNVARRHDARYRVSDQ